MIEIKKNVEPEFIGHFFEKHNFNDIFDKSAHSYQGRVNYFKQCDTFCFINSSNEIMGLIWLKYNAVFEAYEPHVCFLKAYRGKTAIKCCRQWRIDYLPLYGKLRGLTPKKWKHAALFAKLVGFKIKNEKEGFYLMEINHE